jgi:hypothetical protein
MAIKIAMSSGHGLHIRGARGYPVPPQLDEVDEARRVVDRTAEILNANGVSCVTFHDNTSYDQTTNLHTITNWHNAQTRDYDCSVHFNAYDHTAYGCEVLYVTQEALAARMAAAISMAGHFKNRGAKYRSDLYVLNNTDEPAVLVETCFCDHTGDSNYYNQYFEQVCIALAASISGMTMGEQPPPGEQPPAWPDNPYDVPLEDRPVIGVGDFGPDVEDLQQLLNWTELRPELAMDGDFGPATEDATKAYQASRGLDYDGIAGQQTWGALYARQEALPPPPHVLSEREIEDICDIANDSAIASYSWDDRGRAPVGYTQGMALAFAQSCRKLELGHPAVVEMSKARTASDKDALNLYRADYERLGMSNERDGIDTLRHLYALMLGSGMRESSGRHCEGRDQSASNTTSDTAEAGLFQTSYNAHSASDPEFDNLMVEYSNPANQATCYLSQFDDGVSCSSSEWSCYGSGTGYKFQELCKKCPAFAVETHGLTLRNLANHYGPIIRHETELRSDADRMFKQVQDYVESGEMVA